MNLIRLEPARTDPVQSLYKFHTKVDVLRLDLVHPVISGNKWFKLKNYISDANKLNKKILLSFGGAYSNHIVATAAAAHASDMKSIGIIRGEKPAQISHSLQQALDYGMDIFYTSRNEYSKKLIPPQVFEKYNEVDCYRVEEGGFGIKGMEGAMEILNEIEGSIKYHHILAACGTGTMLAGLINKLPQNIKTTGITVLKNNFSVENDIRSLLYSPAEQSFNMIYDYHFGGYAKKNKLLIDFMNDWYDKTGIPSDFVYTGKLFYALDDLMQKGYFKGDENILIIHSGGLQGNNSLPKGTLIF